MAQPLDPRLEYALTSQPSPTPSPGPSESPAPENDKPSPSPSPGPSPVPPAPWGGDPDVGVTPGFLRSRADACDTASEIVRKTKGVADDAAEDLVRAARNWSFVDSIDEMQERWEALNKVVTGRLDRAAENFRLSATAYDANEKRTAAEFS